MSSPITTSFNKESTAAEVISGVNLDGKRVVITGASSGIGVETARALASANAEVILAVRNAELGAEVAKQLVESTGNSKIRLEQLELTSPKSVAAFVDRWDGPIHVLINNAGIMAAPLDRTPEGWELQLATNHIGHFALAVGLRTALAKANGARIIALSSPAHLANPVNFDDLQWEDREYNTWAAYGEAKSANALFAVQADKLWSDDGIRVNVLSPGSIWTGLQRFLGAEDLERLRAAEASGAAVFKTPEQGAATSVLVASSPQLEGVGGRYFEDCQEAGLNQPGTRSGVAAHATDSETADRLWKVTSELVGL
jgi:NAD(P)-dependent dehydrogenase (short-subunit alcohol dehydrogenase family)